MLAGRSSCVGRTTRSSCIQTALTLRRTWHRTPRPCTLTTDVPRPQGDGPRQGALRPPDRRDRDARVPHPVPAVAAERPADVVRRCDPQPVRARARVHASTASASSRAASSRPTSSRWCGRRAEVGAVGRIGQGTFTVDTLGRRGSVRHDRSSATTTRPSARRRRCPTAACRHRPRRPSPARPTLAIGFDVGDTVIVQPGGLEIDDRRPGATTCSSTPGRRCSSPTTPTSTPCRSANPDAGDPLPNVLGGRAGRRRHRGRAGRRRSTRSPSTSTRSPRTTRPTRRPGVVQVRQSFQVIFLLYGLVIPCVTGLFFLIVTFQKAGALTLLRAIGAPAGRLVSALADPGRPGARRRVPDRRSPSTSRSRNNDSAASRCGSRPSAVIFWAVLLAVLGIGSSAAVGPPGPRHRPHRSHHRRSQPMKLALRELRRRPGRFVTATIILTLIAMLLMFLGGLLDGLIRVVDRRRQGAAGRRHRLLRDVAGVVPAQPDRRRHPRRDRGDAGRRRGRRARRRRCSVPGCRATGPATSPRSPCGATRSHRPACPSDRRCPGRRTPTRCCRPTASTSATRCSSGRHGRRSRSSDG